MNGAASWIRCRCRRPISDAIGKRHAAGAGGACDLLPQLFIYFSDNSIRKTVRFFSRRPQAPGCLFVGASESLLRIAGDFDLQDIGGAFVYVRR